MSGKEVIKIEKHGTDAETYDLIIDGVPMMTNVTMGIILEYLSAHEEGD